ncbi:hypothetical protein GCM10009677_43780 [Sphaerisporangium rubeum]|uniref:Uncharacterized protein n=1 Tax=Sphaerisporangium rubeum TaxID=321317 RepID=A0A7X0IJS4_9ACTN|nr:hypothetical protein [Sphaerisporangium rubeum]
MSRALSSPTSKTVSHIMVIDLLWRVLRVIGGAEFRRRPGPAARLASKAGVGPYSLAERRRLGHHRGSPRSVAGVRLGLPKIVTPVGIYFLT